MFKKFKKMYLLRKYERSNQFQSIWFYRKCHHSVNMATWLVPNPYCLPWITLKAVCNKQPLETENPFKNVNQVLRFIVSFKFAKIYYSKNIFYCNQLNGDLGSEIWYVALGYLRIPAMIYLIFGNTSILKYYSSIFE